MNIRISGVGLWARGLTSFDKFLAAYEDAFAGVVDAEFVAPKPATIPARERRRAGLLVNLAVEVAHQACEHARVDKHLVPSVFTSAMGDTMITDYMCRKLSSPEKLLSPTKFHNSVHNAPSGYWTISAQNRAPSTFVGGAWQSFGAGLFEAASVAQAHSGPVLLVGYDIANEPPLHDIAPITETLGVALVLESTGNPGEGLFVDTQMSYATTTDAASNSMPAAPALRTLATNNPMGAALALVEKLAMHVLTSAAPQAWKLRFAAAPHGVVELELVQ